MSDTRTMVRTQVMVNDVGFYLSQDQDVDDLKQRIEAAMQADGRFVDFTVVGNRMVSVMVTPRTHVVVSVETVPFDVRETGDDSAPFGGAFDLL